MNSKLIKASLAGAAAITLAAGGGTFAAWSDFQDVNDNHVEAGILRLIVSGNSQNPGDDLKFDSVTLAPGTFFEKQAYVATSDGESVPNAKLFLTVSNAEGHELGCDTNSEATDEAGSTTLATDPTAPCNVDEGPAGTNPGQLLTQGELKVVSYVPPTPGACSYEGSGGTNVVVDDYKKLATRVTAGKLELTGISNPTLSPGEGVCISMIYRLPSTTISGLSLGNAAQGDTVDFDMRFSIEQA